MTHTKKEIFEQMASSNTHFDPIMQIPTINQNFLYKGKKYPIDFQLVTQYS